MIIKQLRILKEPKFLEEKECICALEQGSILGEDESDEDAEIMNFESLIKMIGQSTYDGQE